MQYKQTPEEVCSKWEDMFNWIFIVEKVVIGVGLERKKCNNTKTTHSLFNPCPLSPTQFGPVNIGVSETQKHCLLESHFSKRFFGFTLLFLSVNFSGIVFIRNNCNFHWKILLSLESTKEHQATSGSFGYISTSFALAWSQETNQMESITETMA